MRAVKRKQILRFALRMTSLVKRLAESRHDDSPDHYKSILRRIKNQLAGYLILLDDAVGLGGVAQRHGAIDDRSDFSLTSGLEGFFYVQHAVPAAPIMRSRRI